MNFRNYITGLLILLACGFGLYAIEAKALDIGGTLSGILNRGGSSGGARATEEISNDMFKSDGQRRTSRSNKYEKEEDAIKTCQLVETTHDPKWVVTVNNDGTYTYRGKASGGGGGSGLKVNVEEIIDPSHPFSPRHRPEWKERQSGSYTLASASDDTEENGNGVQGTTYSYTFVCGRKEVFPPLDGASNQMAYERGFDYYKDVQEAKKGSIFVDTKRHAKFTAAFNVCWPIVWAICEATMGYYGVDCEIYATRQCEYDMCRKFILPPVKPINRLNYAYNNAPEGPETAKGSENNTGGASGGAGGFGGFGGSGGSGGAGGTGSTGQGQMRNNQNLPYIYEANREPSTGKYKYEGFSYYYAEPNDKFGYNGPYMEVLNTGLPASKAALDSIGCDPEDKNSGMMGGSSCSRLDELDPWRIAVVGVNRGYDATGTKDMEEDAHNQTDQIGGWQHLVRYQKNCGHGKKHLCVCKYDDNFYEGSDIGYVMRRISPAVQVSNEKKIRVKDSGATGFESNERNPATEYAVDETEYLNQPRVVPTSLNNIAYKPRINDKDENGKYWPYVETMKGFDKATQPNDVLIYRGLSTSSGVTHRMPYVEIVNKVYENGCKEVSSSNRGVVFDSAGNTELSGVETTQIKCPAGGPQPTGRVKDSGSISETLQSMLGSVFKIDGMSSLSGGGGLPSCANQYVGACSEPDDQEIEVWRPLGERKEVVRNGKTEVDYEKVDYRSFDSRGKCASNC